MSRLHPRTKAVALLCLVLGCSASSGDETVADGGGPIKGDSGSAPDASTGPQRDAGADANTPPGDDAGGATDGGAADDAGSSSDGGTIACERGSTETQWASNCPSTPKTCKAGTWSDPGSTTNDPLQCESAHFAVHSPAGTITPQQCEAATSALETLVWPVYFGAPFLFPEPYCDSDTKYKTSIVIHSDYGLTGGGWGNGYMGMWIGPSATNDHWGLAHEFMHAVQAQTKGLDCGGAASNNFCGWIYESHANFMAHQLPEYRADVHCSEMLVNAPHLYLGSTRDRYCNWQFMEFLKDKHCASAVTDIWTTSQKSNDPFLNIAATRGFDVAKLNDFFGEWAMHNVTWDYKNLDGTDQGKVYREKYGSLTDVSRRERRLRTTRLLPMNDGAPHYVVSAAQAPQRWGYNIVRLHPEAGAASVRVKFRGVIQPEAHSDFRWGLVATDAALTKPRYSTLQRGTDGELDFCVNTDEALFLVVVATPSQHQKIVWDEPYPNIYRYPYMVELAGAQPEGSQPNAPNPSPNGMRWPNGGGWVANGATVASSAYVAPFASVLSGTVGASARIEDSAIIDGANVMSGTVGGLSILSGNFTLSGSAVVNLAWPYGPTFFERPQSAGGTARLLGELELRGANTSKTSGSYCGFADAATASNCAMPDVTTPPPYTFRP
jgi:hypothetical protein